MTFSESVSSKRAAPSEGARALAAVLAARAAFGIAFLGASLGAFHLPLYLPVDRAFTLSAPSGAIAMAWYGATAFAALMAAIAAYLVWFASARAPLGHWLRRRGAVLAIARAGALILLVDFLYFGWHMSHQSPSKTQPTYGALEGPRASVCRV